MITIKGNKTEIEMFCGLVSRGLLDQSFKSEVVYVGDKIAHREVTLLDMPVAFDTETPEPELVLKERGMVTTSAPELPKKR